MSEVFDDENFDDGFDDHKLSKRLNVEYGKNFLVMRVDIQLI